METLEIKLKSGEVVSYPVIDFPETEEELNKFTIKCKLISPDGEVEGIWIYDPFQLTNEKRFVLLRNDALMFYPNGSYGIMLPITSVMGRSERDVIDLRKLDESYFENPYFPPSAVKGRTEHGVVWKPLEF